MLGRSVLGWMAVIAINVVAITACVWLLQGVAQRSPLVAVLILVAVVVAAASLGIVVVQRVTRQDRERPALAGAAGGGELGRADSAPDVR